MLNLHVKILEIMRSRNFYIFLKPRRSQQTQLQLIMTLVSLVKMKYHKKLFQTGSLR